MEFLPINIGFEANDKTGDCLREGGRKINENFASITDAVGVVTFRFNQLVEEVTKYPDSPGTRGDWAMDDDYLYLCTRTGHISGTATWKKIPLHILDEHE